MSDDELANLSIEELIERSSENEKLWAVVEAAKVWRQVADGDNNPTANQDDIDAAVDALVKAVDALDVSEEGATDG